MPQSVPSLAELLAAAVLGGAAALAGGRASQSKPLQVLPKLQARSQQDGAGVQVHWLSVQLTPLLPSVETATDKQVKSHDRLAFWETTASAPPAQCRSYERSPRPADAADRHGEAPRNFRVW
jgi:hypothetical protein